MFEKIWEELENRGFIFEDNETIMLYNNEGEHIQDAVDDIFYELVKEEKIINYNTNYIKVFDSPVCSCAVLSITWIPNTPYVTLPLETFLIKNC